MKFSFSPFLGFCLAVLLCLGLWLKPVNASPSLLNPRINRLESQLRSLQSQVTRIQSQLPRASNSRSTPAGSTSVPDDPDQQFDTLAILVIELQQRVSVLETTLEEITESSQSPTTQPSPS
ncbi:MAG: hypothetical protein ACFB2W_18530 [Leptolyngbyaceae cyanobacterium]